MTPEFPGFANVYEGAGEAVFDDAGDPQAAVSRRRFLQLSAATLGAAALAGCRRPDLEILPFAAVPDDQIGHQVPGKPTFYATCLPRPGGAFPVLVESHDGRPTKIEGNPKHPASLGATDLHAQAAILDLYSPDRVMNEKYPGVMEKGQIRTWADFDREAVRLAEQFQKDSGAGFYVLAEDIPSPSVSLIRAHMKAKLPNASWHAYEPVDTSSVREGARLAFGTPLNVTYRFDKADRILALDCDFLGEGPDAVRYGREFMAKRNADPMNRLYVVESTYTVTGTMADHRLRLPASQIGAVLVTVAKQLLPDLIPGSVDIKDRPAPGFPEQWVAALAADLAGAKSRVIVVGSRQPAWVHALAHALGGGAELREPPPEPTPTKDIAALIADMAAGKVKSLLILGGNPAFNAPADLSFREMLKKVGTTIRLGLYFDQTSEACDWHLPMAHSLEAWGDCESSDGTLCCVQPLIAPLNGNKSAASDPATPPPRGGRSVLELLALLTRFVIPDMPNEKAKDASGRDAFTNPETTSFAIAKQKAYDTVRKVFADRAGLKMADPKFDTEFARYKQLGFLPNSDRVVTKATVARDVAAKTVAERAFVLPPGVADLEVCFRPDYRVFDGRFAMNSWLQEVPDPITKLVWDNAALINPATAVAFRTLKTGDVVKLTVGGRSIEIPVFILPGQADFSVSLPFGQYGEMRISHVPSGGGFDVFPLRTTAAMHIATGATLEPIPGKRYDLVVTQEHGLTDGRDIVREVTPGIARGKAAPVLRSEDKHPADTPSSPPGGDTALPRATPGDHHGPAIGIAPDGHISPADLKKGFQGGYGNTPPPPLPADDKQKRFPLDLARPERLDSEFQWGMVVDLSACTGCSACVVACQSENNIPVVGKGEVARNRELHWLRIDRYFTSDSPDPQVVSQPVACVHCEQAPCEQVCPVNAAVHSPEGLNLQVYNRCIGTRYCANACPYKVRRFNWFDFNKRNLDELRTPTPFAEGGSSLSAPLTPETLRMQKNPDVTVRMRGVMEKCTYCVQRIERAKYGAKIAAAEVAQGRRTVATDPAFKAEGEAAYLKPRDPRAAGYDLDSQGRVIVPDGMAVTACQAACPTQAITFGNLLDPASKVAAKKKAAGEYLLLGELNTKPRTSYLPRRRNPNPDLM